MTIFSTQGCSRDGKEETKRKKNPQKTPQRRDGDEEEDLLGGLNVVRGFLVIKTSCLGSLRAPMRAADTNSRRMEYKPETFHLLSVLYVSFFKRKT